MKILQLASGDLWAGAEVQLFHMVSKMHATSNIEVVVILLNFGQLEAELTKKGIQVLVINEANFNVIQIILKLISIIKEFQPDVIHTHRTKENIIGGVSAFLTKCKSIRTAHGLPEFNSSLRNVIYTFLDRFSARFFQQRVISVSDELKEKLITDFPHSKITVINNGVDIDYIEKQSKLDIGLSVDDNKFNICFIGRFVSVKRVDLFYGYAREVLMNKRNLNIHFHMVGDGPLLNTMKEQAEQDNIESKISFTGFIENTAPYLKQMDMILFTSDNEGLPMTLLEAMVLNVLVMARKKLSTIKEVLLDGECGYVDLNQDPIKFSIELENVINDSVQRRSKISLAHDTVLKNYSIDSCVKEYLLLYSAI